MRGASRDLASVATTPCTRCLAPPISLAVTSPSFPRRAGTLRVALAAPEAFVDPGDRETLPLYTRARVFGRVAKPFAVAVERAHRRDDEELPGEGLVGIGDDDS